MFDFSWLAIFVHSQSIFKTPNRILSLYILRYASIYVFVYEYMYFNSYFSTLVFMFSLFVFEFAIMKARETKRQIAVFFVVTVWSSSIQFFFEFVLSLLIHF